MKDTYVRARLTTMEKDIFEEKAKDFNMTVSDYIKYCCLINPPKINQKSNEKIEKVLANTKASFAVDGLLVTDDEVETGRKFLKGELTEDDALNIINI